MTTEVVLNKWQIECMHTPETIDKIVMNIRKRGMSFESFSYKKIDEFRAVCTIEFEDTPASSDRIFSNMHRLEDIIEIKIL
jgi:hypothetical protein